MLIGRGRVGPVRLAWADASGQGVPDAGVLRRLGESQVRRHAALEGLRAARFVTGRWLLEHLVREACGRRDFTVMSVCAVCGGAHGAPHVSGAPVAVSVSYANGMVAVAVVPTAEVAAVGLDIEAGDPADDRPMGELRPLFAPRHPPALRGWTMIEAALKADGRGVRVPLAAVIVDAPDGVPGSAARVWIPGRAEPVETAAGPAPDGFVLSVAVLPGDERVH